MAAGTYNTEPVAAHAVDNVFVDGVAGRVTSLNGAWDYCEVSAGVALEPAGLARLDWKAANVPCTVAGLLRAEGRLDEEKGNQLDEREFIFRKRFPHTASATGNHIVFDGLATHAEVWLNGEHVASTKNMFRRHSVEVSRLLKAENELILRFRPMGTELARKRPRGRWMTRLVNNRNLRFMRTSLLGRMPGWAPPHPPVGPWRGIRIVERGRVRLEECSVRTGLVGTRGQLYINVRGHCFEGSVPKTLDVLVDGHRFNVVVRHLPDGNFEAQSDIEVSGVIPWWSHDMGTPHRYWVALALEFEEETRPLGRLKLGFRRIERSADDADGFALSVNGQRIFCRGACWTPDDPTTLGEDVSRIRDVLKLVRDAGMNMLRLSGTMTYESDAFYDACDEFGILVWQDFMFASMDYPEDDGDFADEVRIEAVQLLARLHHRPCLAVLCGNSEVEQQAAMKGLPPDAGRTRLFSQLLQETSRRWCPDTTYVTSSPTGGALPFHVDSGIAHYFGVGAYLRPESDARESGVRFASECLAFSNVPEEEGLDELFGSDARVTHTPRYKLGVPRDVGSGWDFSDITDHYLEQLFECQARKLRYSDTDRYLALARIASGEMMARTIGRWRTGNSACSGFLIWFLRDLRPGSGWGVLDSAGRPKAAYWFVKRACAPQATWFTDEGLNGLRVHLRNDRSEPMPGLLRVRLIRGNGVDAGASSVELNLAGRTGQSHGVDAFLGRFSDTTHAYRFGPSEYSIAIAELLDPHGAMIATAHYLPGGLRHEPVEDVGLRAEARSRRDGAYDVRIESSQLALFVRIAAPGFVSSDNYVHIVPGGTRDLVLAPSGVARSLRGQVTAVNSRASAGISIVEGLP